MEARFRIRAAGGHEFALADLDAFVQRVQAGDIKPEDLVFDTLTGEWAPARSHTAYLQSVDSFVKGKGASRQDESEPDDSAPSETEPEELDAPELDLVEADTPELDLVDAGTPELDLVDAGTPEMDLVDVDAPSVETEKRAFIARMEEERRSDPEHTALEAEVRLVDPRSGIVSEITARSQSGGPEGAEPPGRTPGAARRSAARRRSRPRGKPRWGSWAGFSALLCVGLAGTATVAWSALRLGGPLLRTSDAVEVARQAPRAVVPAEAPIRAGAYEGFMHSVDSIRTSLQVDAVPEVWLQGKYLADPSAYPGVRDYWDRLAAFVEAVHDRESALYRGAYLAAAERVGMTGPMLSLRMAGAAGDFAALEPERDSLYELVWNLASAAVSLDRTVVALKGRIAYEPLRGTHVSTAPVIEAAGTDPEAQARLAAGLDQVLAAMKPLLTGHVTREGAKTRVPLWLETGLRTLGSGVD